MEIQDYCIELVRRWKVLVAAAVVGALVGLGLAFTATPSYDASSQLLVAASPSSNSSDPTDSFTTRVATQVRAYVAVAKSTDVINAVIDENKLKESADSVLGRVVISVPGQSTVIEITVTDKNPVTAAAIANSYSRAMVKKVTSIEGAASTGVTISVISPAVPAESNGSAPILPSVLRYLSIFTALAVCVVSVRIYTRRVVLSDVHAASSLGIPLLGSYNQKSSSAAQSRDLTLAATRFNQCLHESRVIALAAPRESYAPAGASHVALRALVESVAAQDANVVIVDCTTDGLFSNDASASKDSNLVIARREPSIGARGLKDFALNLDVQFSGAKIMLLVDPVLVSADAGVLAASGIPVVTVVQVGKTIVPDAVSALRTVVDYGAKNLGIFAIYGER